MRLGTICLMAAMALASTGLSGCGIVGIGKSSGNRVTFDGESFRGRAKAEDRADRTAFAVSIRGVSRSEKGARAAAAYQGTRYCVLNYGVSTIDWDTDPESDQVPIENDVLTLRGRCAE